MHCNSLGGAGSQKHSTRSHEMEKWVPRVVGPLNESDIVCRFSYKPVKLTPTDVQHAGCVSVWYLCRADRLYTNK